jgi:hypothetical protein
MPMGQRRAVSVAQFATNLIPSFPMPPGVSVQSCIGNVGVVIQVPVMGWKQRRRVSFRRASVTINELPDKDADREGIASLVHQEGDWLGARFDYARGQQDSL